MWQGVLGGHRGQRTGTVLLWFTHGNPHLPFRRLLWGHTDPHSFVLASGPALLPHPPPRTSSNLVVRSE